MKILITAFGICLSSIAVGKVIYYGSERENITIPRGKTTILRFVDEIKTVSQAEKFIIEPADSKDPNYRLVTIKPRFKRGQHQVSFILADDSVVNTQITVVRSDLPEKSDRFYDFRPKSRLLNPKKDGLKGGDITEIELMKAMIRHDDVVGYHSRKLIRTVRSGIEGIETKLAQVYSGPKFNGYVFRIRNLKKADTYALDVKSLTLGRPNVALVTQADHAILHPGSSTYLRIVAKPTSVYYAVTLPVAPIIQK